MPVFQYSNPPEIWWGNGSVARLSGEPGRRGAHRAALITTRSLVAEPLPFDPVMTATISQHAPIAEVDEAVGQARERQVDGVVSFGGGSPIDAAKIIAAKLGGPRSLPHIAIPTTLSAAELAAGAGFTDETGTKSGMRDPHLLPHLVIYDSELTLKTPMQLWLSTGIRALDHAIEGLLAEGEHPFNDVMALEAVRRLFETLPRAKAHPHDLEVRTANQLAAWFSFTLPGASASGLSHVMGKQIGARHGIPHGVTSCLLLPHVMRYLAQKMADRVRALPVSAGQVENLIRELELPQHIADYGVGEADLRAAATELAGKYPAEDLLQIYTSAL